MTTIPDDISEYIARYVWMVRDMGREDFVKKRKIRGDFYHMGGVDHLDCRLLRKYQHRGSPVVLSGHRWV